MRTFKSGATTDDDTHKLDYEGFNNPLVEERFAQYMHKHRIQADGKLRASDNWQKGMPRNVHMKSGYRHFMSWWKQHRGYKDDEDIEDALCALIFRAKGYLLELLLNRELHEHARTHRHRKA